MKSNPKLTAKMDFLLYLQGMEMLLAQIVNSNYSINERTKINLLAKINMFYLT